MEGNKLKILWSSVSPTVESGYGRVTNEVVRRLIKAGFDVMNHGYQSTGRLHKVDGTFKILEAGDKNYGVDVIPKYLDKYERDVYITLFDPWIFPDRMSGLGRPWIPYTPVDAIPVSWLQKNKLQYAYEIVCYSEFGRRELEKAGLHAVNIPHGVDTKVYRPLSKKRKAELRKKFGIGENTFVIGSVGANLWDRKDFPRMIRIFAEFNKKVPDSQLYIHAKPDGESGRRYNLAELAKLYGVLGKVKFPRSGAPKLTDEQMCNMYNTFDVYFATSRAEACGMPILEAQACGTPAIVPDNSAQPEWVRGHGWVVPCSDHIVVLTTPQHNKWMLIDIDKAVEALTDSYKNVLKRKAYSILARREMLKYDWDIIVKEKWIPFLNKVYEDLDGKERKMHAEGKVFNIRTGTIDRIVVRNVLKVGEYSKFLHLTKDDVWLDVGGHIGTFAIDIADKVKHVYSFEPNKDNFELLKRNVKENKIKNITIFNKALVGDDEKMRELLLDDKGNTGGHSFISSGQFPRHGDRSFDAPKGDSEIVHCENINAIIKKYNIDKIKMDCEGCEYELIKALSIDSLIEINEMIFEYHFNILGMGKYEELLRYLSGIFSEMGITRTVNPRGQTLVYAQRKHYIMKNLPPSIVVRRQKLQK